MIAEIRILGRFVPSLFQSEVIEAEIRPLLPPCCQRERIGVRIPPQPAAHPDNLEWHQDGGGAAGTTKHMVIWASETPTDFKTSDGELFVVEPFDLVWFDNTRVVHKQPRDADVTTRWHVSVRCSGAMS